MGESDSVLWTVTLVATLAAVGLLHATANFMKNQEDITRLHRRVRELKAQYAQRNKEREESGEDLLTEVDIIEPEPRSRSRAA